MTPISRLQAGVAYPLGAHWDGKGINFTLVAPNAEAVHLCLFDEHGHEQLQSMPLPMCSNGVWHGYLTGGEPGQVYGYRVAGPYAPAQGHRFNPHKVLLDPYARQVVGAYRGQAAFQGAAADNPALPDTLDNAAIALKARVAHEIYEWHGDAPPNVPPEKMIIYELHVKGFTQLQTGIAEELRGSYAGLAQPMVLAYLQQLGITCVNLLPIHGRADERRLQKLGLPNYWGYSSIGFFVPESRYWSGRPDTTPVSEFRDMVKALHSRGIEVILDVVYNHSAESDEDGPTLSFRGIDNALYYHLQSSNPALYENWTGCGNCLDLSKPRVLQMVMDSLRYWVQEMHVDGFRFDLAPVLARNAYGFDPAGPFLAAAMQDPILAKVKLIAEPWDIGPGGYRVGQFPPSWNEWNDQFRDTVRSFWLHQWPTLGEFARRFCASSDYFHHGSRMPSASVNFITAHDGFTLRDLVSYNHKHNDANGEHNRDGHHHNHSWNCGVEGPTDAADVLALRSSLQRALLATLFFSQGTPMMLAGDEIGHSQSGNNNAYCQDNHLTWLDWSDADQGLRAYVQNLIALRKRYPVLRHAQWYHGKLQSDGQLDIDWLTRHGTRMHNSDWECKNNYCIGIRLSGATHAGQIETALGGMADKPDDCLLLLNAEAQTVEFVLPPGHWSVILDSAAPQAQPHEISRQTTLPARTLWLAIAIESKQT